MHRPPRPPRRSNATATGLLLLCVAAALTGSCRRGGKEDDPAGSPRPDANPDAKPASPDVLTMADATIASGSPGCGQPASYRPGTQAGSLRVGGRERTFQVHLPPGYDALRPHPLVLLFHGGLGTGLQMESSSLMSPIADRERFVAVYPDGVSRSWNAGGCCGPPSEQAIDDVGFVAALLDHLESQLCLDRHRVFAGGMSNGAMFSHRLACDLSTRIAAIAPVAGTNMTTACAPGRPVPVMHIHGRQDRHVPWEGGLGCGIAGVPFTSVPDSLAGWLQRNGCPGGPTAAVLEQGDGRCERQAPCPTGADVVLCTIAGGGHSWPGGSPVELSLPACVRAGEGAQSRSFSASEQMWNFFRDHPLP